MAVCRTTAVGCDWPLLSRTQVAYFIVRGGSRCVKFFCRGEGVNGGICLSNQACTTGLYSRRQARSDSMVVALNLKET